MQKLTTQQIKKFQKTIYDHYQQHGRPLPWRKTSDPYKIMVSEIMLQQTQADRVIPKYKQFIKLFPSFRALAKAPLSDVLTAWSGLGYNRRAINLQKAARIVASGAGSRAGGGLPPDPAFWDSLPGIGPATAAAICTYAFNLPHPFIETNVRTVYIHFFFNTDYTDKGEITQITDEQLWLLIEQTLDRKNPRRWYNALMDYGAKLKKEFKNPGRQSAHYVRQSKFHGSNRQLRGRMLRLFVENKKLGIEDLVRLTDAETEKIEVNLTKMIAEGFIAEVKGTFRLR